jgi:hypothetical protein
VVEWKNLGSAGGGVKWQAYTINPDTDVTPPVFRDLYYRNTRLTRSRYPNAGATSPAINGFLRIAGAEYTAAPEKNARDYRVDVIVPGQTTAGKPTEMVVRSGWTMPRQILQGAAYGSSATSSYFTNEDPLGFTTQMSWYFLFVHAPRPCVGCEQDPFPPVAPLGHPGHMAYFENNLSFVDSVGEWFHNESTGQLTVILPSGEDPNDADHEIVYPISVGLVDAQNVTNVTFARLNFGFSNLPFPTHGYLPLQGAADQTTGLIPKGALRFRSSAGCQVISNRIAHTSGSGVEFSVDSDLNTVQGNKIFDIGGTGVYMSGTNWLVSCYGNTILHNKILGFGKAYQDAIGIDIGVAGATLIQGNEVADGGYSGISLGVLNSDCSKYCGLTLPTYCGQSPTQPGPCAGGNQIYNNYVHDVMKLMADGAGIYVRGGQSACYMEFNYVQNVKKDTTYDYAAAAHGMAWDTGATGLWYIDHNVIEDCAVSDGNPGLNHYTSYPIGFHTCDDGGFGVNPFNTSQVQWGSDDWANGVSSVLTTDPANTNCSLWFQNPATLWQVQTYDYPLHARPAAVQTIINGAGAPCGYNYAWDRVNRQIESPGTCSCFSVCLP